MFNKSDTNNFHDLVYPKADSLFYFRQRLFFYYTNGKISAESAERPSVLIAYGENNSEAIAKSGLKGSHQPARYTPIIVVGISCTWVSVVTIAVKHYGDSELKPIYEMVDRIAKDKIANNQHWKAKVRQDLQTLQDQFLPQIDIS